MAAPKKVSKKKAPKKEEPSKVPARALKYDREDAEELEGEAIGEQKEKKSKKKLTGIVALKHKKVFDRLGNNGGKKGKTSMYEAMIAEGYSHEYARKGSLPKSKTWTKLIEERLSDDKLSNIHNQLMVAKRIDYMLFTAEIPDPDIYELLESVNCTPKKIVHGVQGTHVWFWSPDNKSRKDALELAYKIRGKMSPEVVRIEGGLQSKTDAELAEIIRAETKKLQKKD